MPVPIQREVSLVDAYDELAVRTWWRTRVDRALRLRPRPRSGIFLLGDGFEETLYLDEALADDPHVDIAATWAALRTRRGVERSVVCLDVTAQTTEGEVQMVVLVESLEDDDGARTRWWVSLLAYAVHPPTGLCVPQGEWDPPAGQVFSSDDLPAFLRPFVHPAPGARAAQVSEPNARPHDIQSAPNVFAPGAKRPDGAFRLAHFAHAVAANDMLAGKLQGNVVIRVADPEWELFLLGDHLPADLEDMIRYIANNHGTRAQGVALVQLVVVTEPSGPTVHVQVQAEWGGLYQECRTQVDFPEGYGGPHHQHPTRWATTKPVPPEGRWLGVDPMVSFTLSLDLPSVGDA